MRVLHIISGLKTGGAEMMLYKLLSGSNKEHSKHAVVCLGKGDAMVSKIRSLGIELQEFGIKDAKSGILKFAELRRYTRAFQPDVVHGWMTDGNLIALLLAGVCKGTPKLLWSIRDSGGTEGFSTKGLALRRLAALLSFFPTKIICNSLTSLNSYRAQGYKSSRLVLIPNGFDCEEFRFDASRRAETRSQWKIRENEFLIGNIGRYHPHKDPTTFLSAARKFADKHENARFALIGRGMPTAVEVQSLVHSLNLADKVLLFGDLEDIQKLLPAFDCFTLSSWTESFPNALGEAMACEIPCVVTNVGDCAHIMSDIGTVVAAKDPNALHQAWENLYCMSTEERRAIGNICRKRILDFYSLPQIVAKFEACYQECLAGTEEHHARTIVQRL